MDQVAQSTVITAVGDRALERRIGALTKQAPRFPNADAAGDVQGFTANAAARSLQGSQRNQTVFTNGKPGTSISGEPQIRQSAGKKVKNKLAAARLAKPASP